VGHRLSADRHHQHLIPVSGLGGTLLLPRRLYESAGMATLPGMPPVSGRPQPVVCRTTEHLNRGLTDSFRVHRLDCRLNYIGSLINVFVKIKLVVCYQHLFFYTRHTNLCTSTSLSAVSAVKLLTILGMSNPLHLSMQ